MNKQPIVTLLLILILAGSLRLYKVGEIPQGMTNDEATIIYSAYSLAETYKDLQGKLLPASINFGSPYSPVYVYATALFIKIFGFSLTNARILFAAIGIISVLLIYLITRRLFNNEKIALISASLLAISPWHIHITRAGAQDGSFALFFYLLSLYIFLVTLKQGKIYLSLPFFLLSFYSYHATKVFFITFVPVLLYIYKYDIVRASKRQFVIFMIGLLAVAFSFIYVTHNQNIDRQRIFIWNDLSKAAKTVDWERKTSSAPALIKNIYNNKLLYVLRVVREHYLESFSPQFLFLYGETGGLTFLYGTSFRGVFYLLDLPFMILGIVYFVVRRHKKNSKLVLFGLLLAPLASTFTYDQSFVMRNVMILPFLYIITAGGIHYFFSGLPTSYTKRQINVLHVCFILLYTIFLSSYLYQYYYRYPIYAAEAWWQSAYDLVKHVHENKDAYKRVIIGSNDSSILLHYGVINNIKPQIIQKALLSPKPSVYNIELSQCIDTYGEPFTPQKHLDPYTLYIVPNDCHPEATPSATIVDKGEVLRVIWKLFSNPNKTPYNL